MSSDLRKDAVVEPDAARAATRSARVALPPGRRRPWWRRPWIVLLGLVVVAFLAFSLPRYLGLDPQQTLVPSTFPAHYVLLVTHIGFATVAMVTGLFQVWPWFRRRFRVAHRRLGRVYVLGGVIPASILAGIIGSASPFGPMTAVSHDRDGPHELARLDGAARHRGGVAPPSASGPPPSDRWGNH